MDDQELDRRLSAVDPARQTPVALDAAVDELFERPPVRRHLRHHWRIVAAVGGAMVLSGGLAAALDLDQFFLSIPPFSTLDEGTVRVTAGLPYVPVGETDRGEECKIYVDFGGLTASQVGAVNDYWTNADPEAFARGVNERVGELPTTDTAESDAKRAQLLEDFEPTVPGIAWGTAPPGQPFEPGEPHLTTFSTVCRDDEEALER